MLFRSRVEITDEKGNVIAENDECFLKDKYLELDKPKISKKLDYKDGVYYLRLRSNTYTKYLFIDINKTDVVFSDNYFNLYPNVEKVITFESEKEISEKDIKIINLVDSY